MNETRSVSRHQQIMELIGRSIIDGSWPAGTIIDLDQIQAEFSVSRTVVREALRTLSPLGLVQARQQVGTSVLPRSQWAVLHPLVIRWRGLGPEALTQQHELLELRLGVEPVAAELAARHRPQVTAPELLEQAEVMRQAAIDNDPEAFFMADSRFHRALLEGSQNQVIMRHADPFAAVLAARAFSASMDRMLLSSVERHLWLAQAIGRGDTVLARRWAEMIIRYTLDEFDNTAAE